MAANSILSWEEIKLHNTESDVWIVVHGNVYNATKFLEDHPGGKDLILDVAAQDATDVFEEAAHSSEARDILPGLLVGRLKGYGEAAPPAVYPVIGGAPTPAATQAPGAEKEAQQKGSSLRGALTSSRVLPAVAVISVVAAGWWLLNRDREASDIWTPPGFPNADNPLWLSAVVVLLLSLWGFGIFTSWVIYVDYGKLDKYPARITI